MARLPVGSSDVSSIEAPISLRAYLICEFACFGGILFGYDSGYISGVEGMAYVKQHFGHAVRLAICVRVGRSP